MGCPRGVAGTTPGVEGGVGEGPPNQDPAGQESAKQRGQDPQGRAYFMGRDTGQM